MIHNGMMFGGEGPIMQGSWFNPHTGDSFTVRDSFFEDNQYVVTTTDGRYLRFDQLQNYIQSDPKHNNEMKMNLQKPNMEELPPEVSNLIDSNGYNDLIIPEDVEILNKNQKMTLGNLNNPIQVNHNIDKQSQTILNTSEDEDTMLVRRLLKRATVPSVKCSITWNNFPEKQLEMLEMMAVEPDIIVDYFLQQIDLNTIKEIVKEKICERLFLDIKPVAEKEEKIVETTKTSKKTKSTKK